MFSLKAYRIKISFGRGPRTPTKWRRSPRRHLSKETLLIAEIWNVTCLGNLSETILQFGVSTEIGQAHFEKNVSHVSPQTLWFCLLQLSHQLGSPLCMFNFTPKLGCAGWSKVMHMNYKARIKMLWVVCFNKTIWGWHWFSWGFPQWALSFKMFQAFLKNCQTILSITFYAHSSIEIRSLSKLIWSDWSISRQTLNAAATDFAWAFLVRSWAWQIKSSTHSPRICRVTPED